MGSLLLVPKGKMTPKGKAAVSRNALKHGLRGAGAVVRGVESAAEWNRHLAAVAADIAPQGYIEAELTRILAEALWRRRRLVAAESAVLVANAAEGGGPSGWQYDHAKICFEDAQRRLDLLNVAEHESGDLPLIRDEATPRAGAFTPADATWVLSVLLPPPRTSAESDTFLAVVGKSWRTGRELHALVHPSSWGLARRVLEAEAARTEAAWSETQQHARQVTVGTLLPTEAQAAILARYEASIDRAIGRCLAEIERLQRLRAGAPRPFSVTVIDSTTANSANGCVR